MNMDLYLTQAFLVPHALSLLLPRGGPTPQSVGSDGATASNLFSYASRRPLVMLGLKEDIYTASLSAPAQFMAAQERLFGSMWQRLMASPLRVRCHYGHPGR